SGRPPSSRRHRNFVPSHSGRVTSFNPDRGSSSGRLLYGNDIGLRFTLADLSKLQDGQAWAQDARGVGMIVSREPTPDRATEAGTRYTGSVSNAFVQSMA